jgi:hypothetical protein
MAEQIAPDPVINAGCQHPVLKRMAQGVERMIGRFQEPIHKVSIGVFA